MHVSPPFWGKHAYLSNFLEGYACLTRLKGMHVSKKRFGPSGTFWGLRNHFQTHKHVLGPSGTFWGPQKPLSNFLETCTCFIRIWRWRIIFLEGDVSFFLETCTCLTRFGRVCMSQILETFASFQNVWDMLLFFVWDMHTLPKMWRVCMLPPGVGGRVHKMLMVNYEHFTSISDHQKPQTYKNMR